MKKYLVGVIAVVFALSASAFTRAYNTYSPKQTTYYWFQSNAAGTSISQPARSDTPSASDPSGCNLGSDFCSLGYQSNQTMLDANNHRILKSGVNVNAYKASSKLD